MAQNYVTTTGQVNRRGFWATRFRKSHDAIAFWVRDFTSASRTSDKLDAQIRKDAKRVSGEAYAAIVELSTRQAFATFEITINEDDDESDVMGFLKEISSNGDMSVSQQVDCQSASCSPFLTV